MEDIHTRWNGRPHGGHMTRGSHGIGFRGEQDCLTALSFDMPSDGEMRAVAVDGVAGEVEIALAIPCFLLCAMCPQVGDLAGIEDVLLSFVHVTAPFLWN